MSNRAALYLRISKDDARTGLAVDRQRDECLALIRREGLTLAETYTDNGVSAYSRSVKRPAFDQMTRDYEADKFDVVVCWDMDRFSRQPAQLEHWIEMGEGRGLRILTPTEATDLGTDNGRMFARMKATIARAEMERKSARQKAAVRQARENGTYRARTGFNDAEVIRRIFRDILNGKGTFQVASDLNAEGHTTIYGNPWSAQAVRRVGLTSRHRGVAVPEDEFDAVQVLLAPKERVGAKVRGLFSGVTRCGTCGASMTASGDRYTCAWATNHPGSSGHQTIARHLLEERVREGIYHGLLQRPGEVPDDVRRYRLQRAEASAAIDAAVEVEMSARTEVAKSAARRAREKAERAFEDAEVALQEALAARAGANLAGAVREAVAVEVSVGRRLHPGRAREVSLEEVVAALEESDRSRAAFLRVFDGLPREEQRDLARGLLDVEVMPGKGASRVRVRVRLSHPGMSGEQIPWKDLSHGTSQQIPA